MNRERGERLKSIINSRKKRHLRVYGCYAVKMTDTTPAPITHLILRTVPYNVHSIVMLQACTILWLYVFSSPSTSTKPRKFSYWVRRDS